jgi:hypothetical protein
MSDVKLYGALAEFTNPAEVYHACEKVRDAGFQSWDAHTPYPVHGLEKAMGLGRSWVPYIVFVMGITGAITGFGLQTWVSTVAQPSIVSAKPMLSWQAFVPVTFELGILFGSLGALIGMLALNKLPQLYHSLFRSKRFERFSDDRFFISIEAKDPQFDAEQTVAFLEGLGSSHVELVED